MTESVGRPKVRTLQQRLLIVPGVGTQQAPTLGPVAGVAFGGAAVTVQGNSSLNVQWAPVWCKGNMQLLQLTLNSANTIRTLNAGGNNNSKFFGAGVVNSGSLDKWLRWQTAGVITDTNGLPLLRDAASSNVNNPTINGVPVVDFFAQVLNGDFGAAWTADKVQLLGSYAWTGSAGQWATGTAPPPGTNFPGNGSNILFDALVSGQNKHTTGTGALVQKNPVIAAKIDDLLFTQLNYDSWKAAAIKNNSYARPVQSGNNSMYFINRDGLRLYVTPSRTLTTDATGNTAFTSLNQVSMDNLIPADRNTATLRDRVLFVDTFEGRVDGTMPTVSVGSTFFWKGLLYVMGNISTSGVASGQTVWMKNPDEFVADPLGTQTGAARGSCYMDGVLYVNGQLSRSGNGCIYGSLIAKGGYAGSGSPDIYYNSRNGNGLFANDPDGSQILRQIISGPIAEL